VPHDHNGGGIEVEGDRVFSRRIPRQSKDRHIRKYVAPGRSAGRLRRTVQSGGRTHLRRPTKSCPRAGGGTITAVSRCSHTATTTRAKRYRPGPRHPGPSAGATPAVSRRQTAAGRPPLAPTCGHRRGAGGRTSRSAYSRPPPASATRRARPRHRDDERGPRHGMSAYQSAVSVRPSRARQRGGISVAPRQRPTATARLNGSR